MARISAWHQCRAFVVAHLAFAGQHDQWSFLSIAHGVQLRDLLDRFGKEKRIIIVFRLPDGGEMKQRIAACAARAPVSTDGNRPEGKRYGAFKTENTTG